MSEDRARRTAPAPPAARPADGRPIRPSVVAAVQRTAGNAAVSLLLAPAAAPRVEHGGVVAQRLLVRADPSAATINTPDPVIERLIIDGSRPSTGLVNAQNQPVQGDHTTAWALICAEAQQAVEGLPLSRAFRKLRNAVSVWDTRPWAQAMIAAWAEVPTPLAAHQTLQYLKLLEHYAESYLTGRNRQPGAAFLRVGNKQPKASASTGSAGERAALGELGKIKAHVKYTDQKLVQVALDLFDPPFTGPLKPAEVPGFLADPLAPRVADQVTSCILALGTHGKDAWSRADLEKFVSSLCKRVLADMDQQGVYGAHLTSVANQGALEKQADALIDWNTLALVVNL